MNKKKLGIIAAGKIEVRDILNNRSFEWQQKWKNVYCSPLDITLTISGMGRLNAETACNQIINEVKEILVIGSAGGLLDVDQIGRVYLWSSKKNNEKLLKACKQLNIDVFSGNILSVALPMTDKKVAEAAIKKNNYQIVDMESMFIAEVCQTNRMPVSVLRYVTDNADQNTQENWKINVTKCSEVMNQILEKVI